MLVPQNGGMRNATANPKQGPKSAVGLRARKRKRGTPTHVLSLGLAPSQRQMKRLNAKFFAATETIKAVPAKTKEEHGSGFRFAERQCLINKNVHPDHPCPTNRSRRGKQKLRWPSGQTESNTRRSVREKEWFSSSQSKSVFNCPAAEPISAGPFLT